MYAVVQAHINMHIHAHTNTWLHPTSIWQTAARSQVQPVSNPQWHLHDTQIDSQKTLKRLWHVFGADIIITFSFWFHKASRAAHWKHSSTTLLPCLRRSGPVLGDVMLPGKRADAEERSRGDSFLGGAFFSGHFDRDCVEFHLARKPNKPWATGQLPDSSHRKKKHWPQLKIGNHQPQREDPWLVLWRCGWRKAGFRDTGWEKLASQLRGSLMRH